MWDLEKDPVKGDRVEHYGRKAIVKSVYYNGRGEKICEIEYEDFSKGPFYDEVLSDSLKVIPQENKSSGKSTKKFWIDIDKACQYCSTPWKVTKFGNNVWYDCVKCNKTKEQVMKED
jgi:hypothetical protein